MSVTTCTSGAWGSARCPDADCPVHGKPAASKPAAWALTFPPAPGGGEWEITQGDATEHVELCRGPVNFLGKLHGVIILGPQLPRKDTSRPYLDVTEDEARTVANALVDIEAIARRHGLRLTTVVLDKSDDYLAGGEP